MKRTTNNSNYVTVKLRKKDIPILLGACTLGARLQIWFYNLEYAMTKGDTPDIYETTRNWIENTKEIISKIEKMTKIKDVDLSLGEDYKPLNLGEENKSSSLVITLIDNLVKAKCKEIEEIGAVHVSSTLMIQMIKEDEDEQS